MINRRNIHFVLEAHIADRAPGWEHFVLKRYKVKHTTVDDKPFFHHNTSLFYCVGIKMTCIYKILSLTVQLLHSLPPGFNFFLHHLKITIDIKYCKSVKYGVMDQFGCNRSTKNKFQHCHISTKSLLATCNKSTEQRTPSFAVSFVLCVVICLWYVMVTFDYNAFIGVNLLHFLGVN